MSAPAAAGGFYLPLGGDSWLATEHTRGPWDERAQHGGPPSALLARAIERCAARDDMIVARFTCEILGPVPVGELVLTARLARPGRSVEFLEAMIRAGGRIAARAAAWRMLRAASAPAPPRDPPPPPLPERAAVPLPGAWLDGYLSAIEWRTVRGGFTEPGPATVWGRMLYPLVPGEEPTSLQRVLAVADTGSGLSSELDLSRWLFINPELTVHLHREGAGEWICLDAQTVISPGGTGLATSVPSDLDGQLGVAAQSLLISPRRAVGGQHRD